MEKTRNTLNQSELQTISAGEADINETLDQNDVTPSREDSTEEPGLTQHTDSRTVREAERKVESSEPPTISEVEADADVIPNQNDMYLSRGDAIEKLNLSRHSFNVLTGIGIRTVGEVLQLVESARPNMIRQAFGRKFTLEIRAKLAQVTIIDESETEANTNTILEQSDVSLSREDAAEGPSLPQHSPNPPIQTDSQTVGEVGQQVEPSELQTISKTEADTNETSDQNDVPLSQENSTKKIRLTRDALNQIKQTDVRTVGELLQWVKAGESQTIAEAEPDTNETSDQNDVSLLREDATEEQSLTEHSPNPLIDTDSEVVGEAAQQVESSEYQNIPEGEANIDAIPDQNDISLSQEDSTEEPSLPQRFPNPLINADTQTVEQAAQQVESGEYQTTSEIEADTDAMLIQEDVSLSREDSIEKLNLTEYSFNALTALGVQTVGEVLNLVESGKHQPISNLGRKFILEIEGKIAQVRILDDSEIEVNKDAMQSKEEVSPSRKDLIEEPSLPQHSPNQLHPDIRTVGEVRQQVESTEPLTTSEGTANTNATPSQSDTYLSRGDAIEKLNLSQHSLKALKRVDIRMVGELLPRVESGKIRVTRGLGRKSIAEIEEKLAQVKIYDNYAHLSREDSIMQLYLRNRSFNALTRAGVQTIGEALQLVESDRLERIPALGRKSIVEIKNKLAQVATPNDSEGEANTNSSSDRNYGHLSLEDPIEQLNFNPRSFNALTRAGIQTVGEVLQLVESDRLKTIRGLGRKSIPEIKEKLIQPKFLNDSEVEPSTDAILKVVIRWQSELVNKQLSRGLLHEEAIIAEKPIKDWLAEIETIESNHVYEILAAVLGSSLNICEEIEFFLNQMPGQYRMTILLSAYGFETKTLAQTGDELGISRERVRQLRNELKNKATALSNPKARPALLRMQSALLAARDLGRCTTYEQWTQRIQSSGLVGNWTFQDYAGTEPVEVMIAICNLLADCKIPWLQIPENIRHTIQPVTSDIPDVPTKVPHAFETLPSEIKRLINGHTRNSGGIHVKWFAQESGKELEEIKDRLQRGGYRAFSEDWFVQKVLDDPHQISHFDVFHRCLRKMFQYCGPLSIDDVCAGLRHVVSEKKFPVPPPDVMTEILRINGYQRDNELYYWADSYDENLSRGETIIMNCLKQAGSVLHHTELMQAFIESDLSVPSLHATLKRTPLFHTIEFGLYKLRGKEVTYQDIERAKAAGKPQSLRPEIEYDTDGNIIVSVTLSTIAVGSGTILCERFPDLSGENWTCYVNDEEAGELNAVENEFRRLKKPFELLDCQSGDRVQFTFNTWERRVIIEKDEGNAES